MGRMDVTSAPNPELYRRFTRALLHDLEALDVMAREGRIESGIRRIGAEQEVFLIDSAGRPAPRSIEILDDAARPEFTTELGRFNLEINLPPIELGGRCLQNLHDDLIRLTQTLDESAHRNGAAVLLTGILPSLTRGDLALENMSPRQRYRVLNDAFNRWSGGCYRLHLQGVDELDLEHDSVMLEACNASFQVHLQVSAEAFAHTYNAAQAVLAPVLAAAVNSPLLFGRRLWSETRIALFQQSLDTRRSSPWRREVTPRVRFGERWIEDSAVELYREDIARIPTLLAAGIDEDSLACVRQGGVPALDALQVYNGTIYRWNRPCYGVSDGKPHLRIECRVLPSGPTILDEVANAALWIGAVLGMAETYPDIASRLDFDDARSNMVAAARRGLDAGFTWIDGRAIGARELVLDQILPLARRGLDGCGVDRADIDRYVTIVRERVVSGQTGAQWIRHSLARLGTSGTRTERLSALTLAMAERQSGAPCHQWPILTEAPMSNWRENYQRVEQYMTTDLFTVKETEVVDMAALVMGWKRVRQIPVENEQRELVGLVSYPDVLRLIALNGTGESAVAVADVMNRRPVTVGPETSTSTAIRLMREHQITCLPVVHDAKLIGIVTMDDFLPIVERLLEESAAAS